MAFVQLNVGGSPLFTTTRETLMREPTSRLAMIVRGLLPCPRDDTTGAFFVDRDPKHFQLCLNYLRDGCCVLPSKPEERSELLQEIRYYQLAGFEAWMRAQEVEEAMGKAGAAGGLAPGAPALSPYGAISTPGMELRTSTSGMARAGSRSPSSSRPASPREQLLPAAAPPSTPPANMAATSAAMARLNVSPPGSGARLDPSTSSASPQASPSKTYAPIAVDDGYRWTGKYLRNNLRLRDVVTTLLELAHLPPHEGLHGGRTLLSLSVECDHDRAASLLGATSDYLRGKTQVIRVAGAMGWSFQFSVRPSSDPSLFDKYAISEYIQDNWFVLTAVLKDQYGLLLEEDMGARPQCVACRRTNLALSMSKLI